MSDLVIYLFLLQVHFITLARTTLVVNATQRQSSAFCFVYPIIILFKYLGKFNLQPTTILFDKYLGLSLETQI